MSFFVFPLTGDYADTQIATFGTEPFTVQPREFAPTLSLVAIAIDGAPATCALRLFLAPGVGADQDDQIELFNQAITVGAIDNTGRYMTIAGGQGGCRRVWRDATTGVAWTLRASSSGLAGLDSKIRGEWSWTRGGL